MQVVIDIPSPFIDHFHNDRFYDALMRLSSDAHLMAGRYEQETAAMLIKALEKAVEIPEHGRLIDADRLRAKFPEPNENNGGWRNPDEALVHKTGIWAKIDAAPTVIPEGKA